MHAVGSSAVGTNLIIDSKTNEEEAICVNGDGVILLVLAGLKVVQGRHVQTAVHAGGAGQVLHHLWWRLPRNGGLGTVDELK